jgi:hypothetical protein
LRDFTAPHAKEKSAGASAAIPLACAQAFLFTAVRGAGTEIMERRGNLYASVLQRENSMEAGVVSAWFFGYDFDLFADDEIDEKAVVGLRGVVKISPMTLHGTPVLNLDAFARCPLA